VEDRAAARAPHAVDRGARAEHRANEIGPKGVRPVIERLAGTKRRRRVVDEDRDGAECCFAERDQVARLTLVADVSALKRGAAAVLLDQSNSLVTAGLADVWNDDGCTEVREAPRDGPAASGPAGAGHDRHRHHPRPSSRLAVPPRI